MCFLENDRSPKIKSECSFPTFPPTPNYFYLEMSGWKTK